jgi:hypothetical protein
MATPAAHRMMIMRERRTAGQRYYGLCASDAGVKRMLYRAYMLHDEQWDDHDAVVEALERFVQVCVHDPDF